MGRQEGLLTLLAMLLCRRDQKCTIVSIEWCWWVVEFRLVPDHRVGDETAVCEAAGAFLVSTRVACRELGEAAPGGAASFTDPLALVQLASSFWAESSASRQTGDHVNTHAFEFPCLRGAYPLPVVSVFTRGPFQRIWVLVETTLATHLALGPVCCEEFTVTVIMRASTRETVRECDQQAAEESN